MTTIILDANYKIDENKTAVEHNFFGEKVGLLGKLFGCGHQNLSRPFSKNNVGYRSCLNCGARKQFNPKTLETFGSFYFPPIIKAE